MDKDRALTLDEASELAGVSPRTLKRRVREGRLESASAPGAELRIRAGDLVDSGLISPKLLDAVPVAAPLQATTGSWVSATETGELLRLVLAEREKAAEGWKQRTEALYRELIDDQRGRLSRLEEENGRLTERLHEALRQVPKLLELEKVEASAEQAQEELARVLSRAEDAEAESLRLRELVAALERALEESEGKREEATKDLDRLRRRGVWERLVNRGGPSPGLSS